MQAGNKNQLRNLIKYKKVVGHVILSISLLMAFSG